MCGAVTVILVFTQTLSPFVGSSTFNLVITKLALLCLVWCNVTCWLFSEVGVWFVLLNRFG